LSCPNVSAIHDLADKIRGVALSERFLVTGARGCIGSWVLRQLVREGVEVIGADVGGAEHRVRALLTEEELGMVTFLEADVSRPADIERLFGGRPTHVIHLAALQVPA
jgi:nucleoside-diphosphate-sugar epimerase